MLMMLGCSSFAVIIASYVNWRASGEPTSPLGCLIATFRSSRRSHPSHTCPIPPSPSRETRWYLALPSSANITETAAGGATWLHTAPLR